MYQAEDPPPLVPPLVAPPPLELPINGMNCADEDVVPGVCANAKDAGSAAAAIKRESCFMLCSFIEKELVAGRTMGSVCEARLEAQ
jgi:hypothetical protein